MQKRHSSHDSLSDDEALSSELYGEDSYLRIVHVVLTTPGWLVFPESTEAGHKLWPAQCWQFGEKKVQLKCNWTFKLRHRWEILIFHGFFFCQSIDHYLISLTSKFEENENRKIVQETSSKKRPLRVPRSKWTIERSIANTGPAYVS